MVWCVHSVRALPPRHALLTVLAVGSLKPSATWWSSLRVSLLRPGGKLTSALRTRTGGRQAISKW